LASHEGRLGGIAKLLGDEHPQAIAVVIAHLPEAQAAAVLDALPEALRGDIAVRLATLRAVSQTVISDLEADIAAKLQSATVEAPGAALAGTEFTARLIKLSSNKKVLLDALASIDEDLASAIAAQQFVFADLLGLALKDVQLVLRETDAAVLAVALKGADEALKALIFGAMSSRAAAQLQDDLAERGPMKRAEVDAAQAEICALVRRLGESGAVMMPGAAAAYV